MKIESKIAKHMINWKRLNNKTNIHVYNIPNKWWCKILPNWILTRIFKPTIYKECYLSNIDNESENIHEMNVTFKYGGIE